MWGLAAALVLIVGIGLVMAVLLIASGLLIVMIDRRHKRHL